jgi:hypothetical protein
MAGELSHDLNGEAWRERAGRSRNDVGPKSLMFDQRARGVSGAGGSGRLGRLSGETRAGEWLSGDSTSGASAGNTA